MASHHPQEGAAPRALDLDDPDVAVADRPGLQPALRGLATVCARSSADPLPLQGATQTRSGQVRDDGFKGEEAAVEWPWLPASHSRGNF